MALYEKRDRMPPYLAEIPYGFKNLWIISVSSYNLATSSFRAADVLTVTLNGETVSADQLRQLYDYSRDGCSLSQPGTSGLYVTLTEYTNDTGAFSFHVLIEQNLEITGVLGVLGDMVNNSDPQRPVIGHDVQKLDVTQYEADQGDLDKRLSTDEADIQTNANKIAALQAGSISAITLNGDAVPVTSGTAKISIDAVSSSEMASGLAGKVDKTVAGAGNTIVQSTAETFDQATRTLTLSKNLLSLENGSTQGTTASFALADLLGITDLENIDKELFYFCPIASVASYSGNTTIPLSNLYGYNPDGSTYNPTTTASIRLVFAVATNYSGFGQAGRTYISAIGKVLSTTGTALTCSFTNFDQFMIYNRYNGYRSGTIIYDPTLKSIFQALQNVPRPTAESNIIALSNALYYAPVVDYSIMAPGTIWANFELNDGAGRAYPVSQARLELLKGGAGYDNYVSFIRDTIPTQILTDADWNSNVSLWVTDGLSFTSRDSLLNYLSNFGTADRFKLSNRGIIATHYESGGITITPTFTQENIQSGFTGVFQPVPSGSVSGQIPVYDASSILVGSGKALTDFATAAQGAKADSAVQSVVLATGDANGTLRLTVDGNTQSATVQGLGSAAFTSSGSYATSAQGAKADSAIQTARIASGPDNGTVQLSTNGVAQSAVKVTGLGSASFTNTTDYATAAQGLKADSAVQSVTILSGTEDGAIQYQINGGTTVSVPVAGLGSAAFTASDVYATAGQGSKADTALQPSDVVDNTTSTDSAKPLSANQGRELWQLIQNLSPSGRPIGGFQTYAEAYTNTSQYSADLQPITVGDTIYIAADENHTDRPAQYKVAEIAGNGDITYSFVAILPDAARDFATSPIQPDEIALGAITAPHIQNGAVTEAAIANNAVTDQKLSSDVRASLERADSSLQTGITTTGTGSVVTSVSQNQDNTLNVSHANAVMSVQENGTGDFITGAGINGSILELNKDGTALKTVSVQGSGNVLVDASGTERELTLTKGTVISSIGTTGSGNVLTDITADGVATRGTMLASIAKSGTGNVLTGVSSADGAATLESGTAVMELNTTGTGNMVTDLTLSGGTITATKGMAVTSLPEASTAQPGVTQLNNTLTSTATDQALTAAQGKALADQMATNDSTYVKLTGNQTKSGTLALENHLIVPSKTSIPSSPLATAYATEAQAATRIARPGTASINNMAVFDANRDVVDSGVSYESVQTGLADAAAFAIQAGSDIIQLQGKTVTYDQFIADLAAQMVKYSNSKLPGVANVKQGLDQLTEKKADNSTPSFTGTITSIGQVDIIRDWTQINITRPSTVGGRATFEYGGTSVSFLMRQDSTELVRLILSATALTCTNRDLGSTTSKWKDLYIANPPIVGSDKRIKKDITPLKISLITKLLMEIPAVQYRLIGGDSGRYHYGFLSQDVEAALTASEMTGMDFAGFIKSPVLDDDGNETGDYIYALRLEEFIPILWAHQQNIEQRIQALEARKA